MKGQMNVKTAPLNVKSRDAYRGNMVNPKAPKIAHVAPRNKNVPIAPAINAGTSGHKDGAKRVINSEGSPAGRNAAIGKSTFRAPRKEGMGSVTDAGYTRIDMSAGAKGNGRGNGKR